MIRAALGSLVLLTVSVVAGAAHAASVSPQKTAVYASTTAALISEPPTTAVTATIAKGKKKRVLEVDLSAAVTAASAPGAGILSITPTVNGLAIMEPVDGTNTAQASTICGDPPLGCSLTFAYWLDLDAAEAAHPGVFIKQPLVIEGQIAWSLIPPPPGPGAPVTAAVSLRARLQKK